MTDAAVQEAMMAPVLERRDDNGRLVSVTWHGAGTMDLTGDDSGSARWLVAVDGSECSLRAVAMAAQLVALEPHAELALVHVQPWLSKEAAETELPRRGWAATAQARALLDAAPVRWRLHAVMGETAQEIAGLADALGSRGIVIGSRGLTAAESLFLGSVAYKVVHSAKLPVLIVR